MPTPDRVEHHITPPDCFYDIKGLYLIENPRFTSRVRDHLRGDHISYNLGGLKVTDRRSSVLVAADYEGSLRYEDPSYYSGPKIRFSEAVKQPGRLMITRTHQIHYKAGTPEKIVQGEERLDIYPPLENTPPESFGLLFYSPWARELNCDNGLWKYEPKSGGLLTISDATHPISLDVGIPQAKYGYDLSGWTILLSDQAFQVEAKGFVDEVEARIQFQEGIQVTAGTLKPFSLA